MTGSMRSTSARSAWLRVLVRAGFLTLFACVTLGMLRGESRRVRPYSVQLHLHGPFSEGRASIDSHCWEATDLGVDVLWWTEHDFRLNGFERVDTFGFESLRVPFETGESWKPMWPGKSSSKWIQKLRGPEDAEPELVPEALEGQRSLRLRLTDAPDDGDEFVVSFESYRWLHRRPLAAHPLVRLGVRLEEAGPGSSASLRIELSEHAPRDGLALDHVYLEYRFVPEERVGEAHRAGDTYVVPVSCPVGAWRVVELDPRVDCAAGFPGFVAEDNSLRTLELGIEAAEGSNASVLFDALELHSREAKDAMLGIQAELLEEVGRSYPSLRQHQGVEVSYVATHLNEFSAEPELIDYDRLRTRRGNRSGKVFNRWVSTQAVERIHARGGLVSYNHAFGTNSKPGPAPHREGVLQQLVANDVLGADLLEVGYRERGSASLEDHLWLWDGLALAGHRLVGIGVSDSHGGASGRWRGTPNNFVSWILAESTDRDDLLRGLAAGRVFFGDIEAFDGSLDLETDTGARMGDTLTTDVVDMSLTVRLDGLQRPAELVLIRSGEEVERRSLAAGDHAEAFDVPLPAGEDGFVRVELRQPSGEAFVLSNPIWILRPGGEAGR